MSRRTCCCWAPLVPPLSAWRAPSPCSSCPPGAPGDPIRQLGIASGRAGGPALAGARAGRSPTSNSGGRRCSVSSHTPPAAAAAHRSLLTPGLPPHLVLQHWRRRRWHCGQGCSGQRRALQLLAGVPPHWRPLAGAGPQGATPLPASWCAARPAGACPQSLLSAAALLPPHAAGPLAADESGHRPPQTRGSGCEAAVAGQRIPAMAAVSRLVSH